LILWVFGVINNVNLGVQRQTHAAYLALLLPKLCGMAFPIGAPADMQRVNLKQENAHHYHQIG
jgi:hypothetical protein